MGRRERAAAKAEGRAPRTLLEADFLMLVEDQTRLGALRFRGRGTVSGQILAADGTTPVPGSAVNLFPDPASRPARYTALAEGGPKVSAEFIAYVEG